MTPPHPPAPRLTRRHALLLSLLVPLAACGVEGPAPPVYQPPNYDYLTRLRLKVAKISIDDSWVPRGEARHVEYLAPTTPRAALRTMAEQRLVAVGSTGEARFSIEDASIIRARGQYLGTLAVRLEVTDAAGDEVAQLTARVAHTREMSGDDPEAVRADLYALVKDMMRDMNVEFEYQIRRVMADRLEATDPTAPPPPPVQSEELTPPGATP
jgi:hypothetical protein